LRIEWRSSSFPGQELSIEADGFAWNVAVNEADFELAAPPGYTVKDATGKLTVVPTEKDLLETLGQFATAHDGRVPDDFSMAGLQSVFRIILSARPPEAYTLDSPDAENMFTLFRGVEFAGDVEFGDDWHYAGRGVQLGEHGRPVLWYRPAGQAAYHV